MRYVACVICLSYTVAFAMSQISDPFVEQREEYERQMQYQAERERIEKYAGHHFSE